MAFKEKTLVIAAICLIALFVSLSTLVREGEAQEKIKIIEDCSISFFHISTRPQGFIDDTKVKSSISQFLENRKLKSKIPNLVLKAYKDMKKDELKQKINQYNSFARKNNFKGIIVFYVKKEGFVTLTFTDKINKSEIKQITDHAAKMIGSGKSEEKAIKYLAKNYAETVKKVKERKKILIKVDKSVGEIKSSNLILSCKNKEIKLDLLCSEETTDSLRLYFKINSEEKKQLRQEGCEIDTSSG